MIKVSWDQGFKRVYRKKVKNDAELKGRFWDAMEMFAKDPFHYAKLMPRGLPWGTLCWVSKGAPSTPLVKGGVQCPAREVERRAMCGAS